jgi:uncharacterized membrane protein HdeD (DUF308 family)
VKVLKRNRKNKEPDEQIDGFRSFQVYVILTCAILLTSIGLFLIVKGHLASGTSMSGRSGQGRGQRLIVSGPGLIAIGVLVAIYPLIEILQRARRRQLCA